MVTKLVSAYKTSSPLSWCTDRQDRASLQRHHNPYSNWQVYTNRKTISQCTYIQTTTRRRLLYFCCSATAKVQQSILHTCTIDVSMRLYSLLSAHLFGSYWLSQSTSCSSESEVRSWPALAHCPSTFSTVLKAQQEPADPWSFTSVTRPWSLQSKESGGSSLASKETYLCWSSTNRNWWAIWR